MIITTTHAHGGGDEPCLACQSPYERFDWLLYHVCDDTGEGLGWLCPSCAQLTPEALAIEIRKGAYRSLAQAYTLQALALEPVNREAAEERPCQFCVDEN